MNKVPIALMPDIMKGWGRRLKELGDIEPEFHRANTDDDNGCPDISSERKINRYIDSLIICDSPGNPLANSLYNEIMRNAHKYLTNIEYKNFTKKMKSEKIGTYNRNDESEEIRAKIKIEKMVKGVDDCCATCNKHSSQVKLMKCSKCRKQLYCSVECQKSDWKNHIKECWGV